MSDSIPNKLEALCNISSPLNSMPNSYKKLSSFILKNPAAIERLTITQLAKKLSIDPANITRFCQYLGFKGYADFKYALKYNVITPIKENPALFEEREDSSAILKKIRSAYPQIIGEVIELLDPHKIEVAARVLLNAQNVYLYAQGGNITSAHYAHFSLWQIGISCHVFTDPGMMSLSAKTLSREDAAIGFTLSGDAKFVVDAMRTAHRNRASTIAICGFGDSSLGDIADILLSYNARIPDNLQYLPLAFIGDLTVFSAIQAVLISEFHPELQNKIMDVRTITRVNRFNDSNN